MTETLTHRKGIASTEDAYYAEHGICVSVPAGVPASMVGGIVRVPWPGGTRFDEIGWAPEGGVVFQYAVRADDPTSSGTLTRFGGLAGAMPGTTCVDSGVYGPGGQSMLGAPGPCDTASGRSRF